MMKYLAAAACLSLMSVSASAVTVDLNSLALTNNDIIDLAAPGFGDDGPVDLDWDPLNAPGTRLLHWNGEYSGRSAAWCAAGGSTACALDLNVATGSSITLSNFSLGGWRNQDRNVSWTVLDLANNSIVDSGTNLVSGTLGLLVTIAATSTVGFRINFGPDGFNGGITELNYSHAPVSAVPLPAGFLLLGTALAGLGAVRRMRAKS